MFTPKISICIPTYESSGKGVFFLKKNIDKILDQTYKNYEIIISDHSIDSDIENFVISLKDEKIKYYRYSENIGKPAFNTNNAISKSTGDFIKLMNLDDHFAENDALEKIVKLINEGYKWILIAFKHYNYDTNTFYRPMIPAVIGDGNRLLYGENTIGCPSVGLIPKDEYFDTDVKYMIDCELWYRMYKKYGSPGILREYKITIGTGNHTLTNQLINKQREMILSDIDYCNKKYKQ